MKNLITSLSFVLLLATAVGGAQARAETAQPLEVTGANIFVHLAKKVVPSVVNISSMTTVKTPFQYGGQEELFRRFFGDFFRQYNGGRGGGGGEGGEGEEDEDGNSNPGPRGGRKLPKSMSLGTGFIIDASGLILTNNHVVAEADEIKISFTEEADEKPTDAEVVGRDPEIDVALIKVKNKRVMIPVNLGNSDSLDVGEYVMAVGNPFGQGHSVTHGIISAKGRTAPEFPLASYLQTDAPINPGNSGGPLVNLKGEVIGINNAIDQRAQGIGFAIPINLVKQVLPQLRSSGKVARGYIGVAVRELTPKITKEIGGSKSLTGPVVTHVYADQPADKAGVKVFDVITQFNGKEVRSGAELVEKVTGVKVGETVPMVVNRNGKSVTVQIKVTQRPGGSGLLGSAEGTEKKKPKKPSKIEMGMALSDITTDIARDLDLPPKSEGAVVSHVTFGGPADKAGLMRGDLILEVGREPAREVVKNVDDFYNLVKEKKSYLLRVRRADPQGRESFEIIVLDLK